MIVNRRQGLGGFAVAIGVAATGTLTVRAGAGFAIFVLGGVVVLVSAQRHPPDRGRLDNVGLIAGGVVLYVGAIWAHGGLS